MSEQPQEPEGEQPQEPEGEQPQEPEGEQTVEPEGEQTVEPEGEQTVEPEGEQTVEQQPQAVSEADIEKQGKALDRASKSYSEKVVAILGDELGAEGAFATCELCNAPFPGIRMNRTPEPDVLERLRVLIGLPSMETYEQDRYSRQCDICSGRGRVKTGSEVDSQRTLPCLACEGKGWQAVGDERRVPANAQVIPFEPATMNDAVDIPAGLPPAAVVALRAMLEANELAGRA